MPRGADPLARPAWQIVAAMHRLRITQSDVVAGLEGVPRLDRSVVSRVIHRLPGVHPGTRQRVLDRLRALLIEKGGGDGLRPRAKDVAQRSLGKRRR
jgi:hypothetical protein